MCVSGVFLQIHSQIHNVDETVFLNLSHLYCLNGARNLSHISYHVNAYFLITMCRIGFRNKMDDWHSE